MACCDDSWNDSRDDTGGPFAQWLATAGEAWCAAAHDDGCPTIVFVSAVDPTAEKELVVAEDGSIPAEQLARLGLRPGAHLRVVESAAGGQSPSLAGSLPDFPDLDWYAFERASELARRDVTATS